jgi:hypothetical protein
MNYVYAARRGLDLAATALIESKSKSASSKNAASINETQQAAVYPPDNADTYSRQ